MYLSPTMQDVRDLILADVPVFIWGAPGIGKSESVRQLGDAMNLPVLDWRALLRDPVDVRGIPVPNMETGQTIWLRPSDLPFIGNPGPETGILFMDELNAAGPAMQAACFGVVQERRAGEHVIKPGWRIVAAGNRQSDKAAAQRMPTPLRNRFAHVTMEPDVNAWCQWAAATGLNALVLAFIRFRPALLHVMPGTAPDGMPAMPADANAFPTPRAWARVAALADAAGNNVRQSLVASLVGDGAAAEFEGFAALWRNMPPIADLIANPDRAPVPAEPGLMYAVASALARAAKPANFAAVLRYAARLPLEFATVLIADATRRDAALKETAAFTQWAVANQAVTL